MKNNNNKNKEKELEKLEYKILGDLFIADMMNMGTDGDNSVQNLMMYLDSEDIKDASKKYQKISFLM